MVIMESKLTIADVFRAGLSKYRTVFGNLSAQQWKVANNIMNCHTPALGFHQYQCDHCKHSLAFYHSCRDRHCPSCQSVSRAEWVEARLNELLPVGYFHVVFTLPQELNQFALYNRELFYQLFYRAVSETLTTLTKDNKWLGGTIGIIAILHTWGQNLLDHPHVHCIIPGGGISPDGKKWLQFRENYFLPFDVMGMLFRRLFLKYFLSMTQHKDYKNPPSFTTLEASIPAFIRFLKNKKWVVYAKEPFASPKCVVKYLSNYTHRIAISNQRLIKMDYEHVWFRWKDYKDNNNEKIQKLKIEEFIRRYLLHVLPSGFVRIRYYGFYSNRNRTENISRCFTLLSMKFNRVIKCRSIGDYIKKALSFDLEKCRMCSAGRYLLTHKENRARGNGYYTHRATVSRSDSAAALRRPGLRSFNKGLKLSPAVRPASALRANVR
jgi:hypothetical protein